MLPIGCTGRIFVRSASLSKNSLPTKAGFVVHFYNMSFSLHDLGSEGFQFNSNVWNWKAGMEIIKSLDIVGDGMIRQMGYNATGMKVDAADAHAIGQAIRDKILPKIPENGRIFSDLRVTDEPDDMTLHRDDDEQWKNYSVTRDWLAEFSEFCIRSKGFQIF